MPDSSLSYAVYHVSASCELQLELPNTLSALPCIWKSTAPKAYWLASTCRQYLASGSGRARNAALQSFFFSGSKACWDSLSQANRVRMTVICSTRRRLTSHFLLLGWQYLTAPLQFERSVEWTFYSNYWGTGSIGPPYSFLVEANPLPHESCVPEGECRPCHCQSCENRLSDKPRRMLLVRHWDHVLSVRKAPLCYVRYVLPGYDNVS